MVTKEYVIKISLYIQAKTPEEALREAEKRIGNSDYSGEDVTIERV